MQSADDERAWVDRARAGDPEAVGWLYERYFERIFRYLCARTGDPGVAEDLTEQVFLRMIEAVGGFQWQQATFVAWLYRIAHNLVIDSVRRDVRFPLVPIEPLADLLPSERDDPVQAAEQSEFRAHLLEALSQLTGPQAQVIRLKFGADLSNAQVAALLGRSEGAVKSLQYSALRALSKLLTVKGYR